MKRLLIADDDAGMRAALEDLSLIHI